MISGPLIRSTAVRKLPGSTDIIASPGTLYETPPQPSPCEGEGAKACVPSPCEGGSKHLNSLPSQRRSKFYIPPPYEGEGAKSGSPSLQRRRPGGGLHFIRRSQCHWNSSVSLCR